MDADKALDMVRDAGAPYAEVRVERRREFRLSREDGELRTLVEGAETGFHVRVLWEGAWGGASSNELTPAAVRSASRQALAFARSASNAAQSAADRISLETRKALHGSVAMPVAKDPQSVSLDTKLELLQDMETAVQRIPAITSVTTSLSHSLTRKEYADSEGTSLSWTLPRIIAQCHFTAKKDGHLGGRGARTGATLGWEAFDQEDPVAKSEAAAHQAISALGARSARGGKQKVVIDHELAGVFAHEAVGHAAEADLIVAGESCFKGRLGTRLGVPGLSIHDDSTLPGAFGSFPYDDTGVAGRRRPILEDGVLTGFLCDRENATRLDHPATGSARAQDASCRPLVRMSNTLISPGSHSQEEVFAGIRDGVYCKGSRGGQVDTARGTFLFNAQEAYVIRNGEIAEPLRDVSLTGDILSTLMNIEALGNKFELGDPGHCGKGQWVPVCDGGPLVRIKDCLVGGAG